jgi:SAM-dependent methyltransferase
MISTFIPGQSPMLSQCSHSLRATMCAVCHGPLSDSVLACRDDLCSGESFDLLLCPQCGSLSTDPVPDILTIAKYYPSAYSPWGTGAGLIDRINLSVRRVTTSLRVKEALRMCSASHGRLLDIGCGDGTFLRAMSRRSWEVHGVEPDPRARERAAHAGTTVDSALQDVVVSGQPGFDLVTLWHSLEHIHDLDATLSTVSILLAPAGRVLVAVPNFQSIDAVHYGSRWDGYQVPRHLHHFSIEGMRRLAERNCLAIDVIRPLHRDTIHASIRSEQGSQLRRLAWGGIKGMAFALRGILRPLSASSLLFVLRRETQRLP